MVNVGDTIIVTNAYSNGGSYLNGDKLTVAEVWPGGITTTGGYELSKREFSKSNDKGAIK